MAVTVPSVFIVPLPTASGEASIGLRIGKQGEAERLVETPNALYSTAARRVLASVTFSPALQSTTSGSAQALEDTRVRMSEGREDMVVETYGEDLVVVVGVYSTAGALLDSVTLTHPAGGRTAQSTISLAGITQDDVLVRVSISRNVTAGELDWIRVLEDSIAAGDLPT